MHIDTNKRAEGGKVLGLRTAVLFCLMLSDPLILKEAVKSQWEHTHSGSSSNSALKNNRIIRKGIRFRKTIMNISDMPCVLVRRKGRSRTEHAVISQWP